MRVLSLRLRARVSTRVWELVASEAVIDISKQNPGQHQDDVWRGDRVVLLPSCEERQPASQISFTLQLGITGHLTEWMIYFYISIFHMKYAMNIANLSLVTLSR